MFQYRSHALCCCYYRLPCVRWTALIPLKSLFEKLVSRQVKLIFTPYIGPLNFFLFKRIASNNIVGQAAFLITFETGKRTGVNDIWTTGWFDSSISSVIELRLVWTSFLDFRQLKWSPIDHWVPACVPCSLLSCSFLAFFAFFKNNFVRRHTTTTATSPPPTLAQPRQNRLFDRDKTKTSLFRHWPFFYARSRLSTQRWDGVAFVALLFNCQIYLVSRFDAIIEPRAQKYRISALCQVNQSTWMVMYNYLAIDMPLECHVFVTVSYLLLYSYLVQLYGRNDEMRLTDVCATSRKRYSPSENPAKEITMWLLWRRLLSISLLRIKRFHIVVTLLRWWSPILFQAASIFRECWHFARGDTGHVIDRALDFTRHASGYLKLWFLLMIT